MIQETFQGIETKPILQSQLLKGVAGIDHYCSMRGFKNAGAGVWMPKQVHGTEIVFVNQEISYDETAELQAFEADAVVTQEKDLWIGVRTADCVPVLLYDPVSRTVAAVHAGWRGSVKHIVTHVIESMQERLHISPENLLAMIGPSICAESFEVGEEVAMAFRAAGRADCVISKTMDLKGHLMTYKKPHIDLWLSNVMDLLEAGVSLDQIDCTPVCTFQNDEVLFSARKQGIDTGRIVTAIKLV